MYVRLGFSVAINVDPDVLLVDEVLAVGDEAFQRKCNEKFAELKEQGKTIVLVSHGMSQVHNLCEEVAWFEHGKIKLLGPARKVVDEYTGNVQVDREEDESGTGYRWGSGEGRIEHVQLLDAHGEATTKLRTGEAAAIRLHYQFKEPVERPVFGLAIHTIEGTHVTGPNSRDVGCVPDKLDGDGFVDIDFSQLRLLPGTYDLTCSLYDFSCMHPYDFRHKVLRFDVAAGSVHESYGLVSLGGRWRIGDLVADG